MQKPLVVLLGIMLLVYPALAMAATIALFPEANTVAVGDVFDVDLVATLNKDEIIDWYDIDVKFDHSILSYTAYTIGSGLGDIYNDYSIEPGDARRPEGIATLAQASDSDLHDQAGTVWLATLTFAAQNTGPALFDFGFTEVKFDSYQYTLALGDLSLDPAKVNVTNAVPLPAGVWLLGSGLIGLFGIGRKFR